MSRGFVAGWCFAFTLLPFVVPAHGQSLSTLKTNKVVIQDIQVALNNLGYPTGKPTGSLGPKTNSAFAKFLADKGLASQPLDTQLLGLGIDLSALKDLKFTTNGSQLFVDNGLPNNIDKQSVRYNWQSFEVGRYRVIDGEEVFKLDLAYCENFDRGPGGDCDTGRHRVQLGDDSRTKDPHVLYSFEFLAENLPEVIPHIQFAELFQNGGFVTKHYESKVTGSFTPRFTLEIQQGEYTIQDNSLIDISLIGGSLIGGASVPVEPGKWVKVEIEVNWSPESDGYFHYWLDGKPLWARTGRNATCLPGSKCELTLKYGPYASYVEGLPDFKDDPIVFRYRGMTKVIGDKAIADYLGARSMAFAVKTIREGGPTKPVRIVTTAMIEHDKNPPPQVNVLLRTEITDAKAGANMVSFNIQGRLHGTRWQGMRLVFSPPLGSTRPEGLATCAGQTTDEWDGEHHALLEFTQLPDELVARDVDCRIKNSPPEVARMMNFMLTSFKELAADMITSGNIATIQNAQLRNWITLVAEGKVTVRR